MPELTRSLATITGARRAAPGAAREKTHQSERGYGTFRRLVTLPSSHVRGDRAEAAVRDGVLPPTANVAVPDPDCDLDYIPETGRRADIEYAVANATMTTTTVTAMIIRTIRAFSG